MTFITRLLEMLRRLRAVTPLRVVHGWRYSLGWRMALVVLSLAPLPGLAQNSSSFPVPEGFEGELGKGFSSLSGEVLLRCVEGGPLFEMHTAEGGPVIERNLALVESLKQLNKFWSISAQASLNLGIFGGEAKARYTRSRSFEKYSIFAVIKTRVANANERLSRPRLTQAARALLNEPNPRQAFFRRCGDSFFSARTTGGEFNAIFRYTTTGEREHDELRAQLRVVIGPIKGRGSVEYSLERAKSFAKHHVDIVQIGGQSRVPDPYDIKGLMDFAWNFQEEVHPETGAPVEFTYTVSSYAAVEGVPNEILIPRGVMARNRRLLNQWADQVAAIEELLGNIQFILDNDYQFASFDEARLLAARDALEDHLANVEIAAADCADTLPDRCTEPALAAPPSVDLPKRTFADRLGSRWEGEIDTWKVVWIRKDRSANQFEARWRSGGFPIGIVRDDSDVTVTVTGTDVEVIHHRPNGQCRLTGKLVRDHVSGEGSCPDLAEFRWHARIYP